MVNAEEIETSARSEPGILSCALKVSADGETITFYDRYADEAAVITHRVRFGERIAERHRRDDLHVHRVLGSPGDEDRTSISGCKPVHHAPFAGFSVR